MNNKKQYDASSKTCLANNLRCDYYLSRGIVILKEQDKMTLQNPGSICTGKEQMIRGGVSDSRNKTIMKRLNLTANGERAGSAVLKSTLFELKRTGRIQKLKSNFHPDRIINPLVFIKQAET